MDDSFVHNIDRKRRTWFLWGVVLSWVVAIPFIIGLSNTFKGISDKKLLDSAR